MKVQRWVIGLGMVALLVLQGCIPGAPVSSATQAAPVAEVGAPAVRSLEVLRGDSSQGILVVARMTLASACYRLGDSTVDRQGRQFTVTIPQEKTGAQACGSLPLDQDQVIHLTGDALAPGTYVVLVNGFLGTFSVASQAPAAGQPTVVAGAESAGAAAPTALPTATLTAAPTSTPAPTLTATPTVLPTLAPPPTFTPTATPLALAVGSDPASCVNKAAFYADLTVPDGTPFAPGGKFTKTWLVMNVGSCTWGAGYQLVFAGGDPLGAPLKLPLPAARPKQVVQVSVDMTAPEAPQGYVSQWAFQTPDGYLFGTGNPGVIPLTVKVVVVARPVGLPSGLDCGAVRLVDMEKQVLDEINKTRASFGLYPYQLADDISQTALNHSLEMACYNYEDHRGRDGMLYNVRLQRDSITFETSNEMIYSGNGGPAGAVDWWMHSHIHRPITLSSKYTVVGIGFVYYDKNPYKQRITVDLIVP